MKALIVAMILVLSAIGSVSADNGEQNNEKKVWICHHNNGSKEYVLQEISENALDAHLSHQWGMDIYPVPEGGCPVMTPEVTPTPVVTIEPTIEVTPSPTVIVTPEPTVAPLPTETLPSVTPTTVVPEQPVTTPDDVAAPIVLPTQSQPVTIVLEETPETTVRTLPITGSGTSENDVPAYLWLGVAALVMSPFAMKLRRR